MGNQPDDKLYRIRHSLAHVMAQAVLEMFPTGKIAIGPPIEDGFYYDFDLPRNLTPEDLTLLEKRMREILQQKHAFQRRELSAAEAKALFAQQPYKIELIEGLEKGGVDEYGEPTDASPVISTYRHDTFEDLCKGPHVANLGEINPAAFKLTVGKGEIRKLQTAYADGAQGEVFAILGSAGYLEIAANRASAAQALAVGKGAEVSVVLS